MTGPSSSTRAATASYTLTVSEDPRLVGTVRDVTAKTAEVVGLPVAAASRLAAAVEQVATALAHRPAAGAGLRLFEIRFNVDPDALRVHLICEGAADGAGPDRPAAWTLERWLRQHGVLEAVRELAPDAELVVAGSPCACRFTCPYSSGA